MNKRFYFEKSVNRVSFFKDIMTEGGFNSVKEFIEYISIPKSTLERYKNGESTISEARFQKLKTILPPDKWPYYLNRISTIDENWGMIKGGKITAIRHPEIIEHARSCISHHVGGVLKYDFDKDQKLTEELCEFLGAFIGDGFTNYYKNRSPFVQFTGDKRYDMDYYKDHIIKIAKKLFGVYPYICTRKTNNTMYVTFFSKKLYEMLTERFGFPAGVKSYTVKIPQEVLDSEKKFIIPLLRGIFDTDGCIYYDRRPIYKTPYLRMDLHMNNKPLLKHIHSFLNEYGIAATQVKKFRSVQIVGKEKVEDYLRLIGFSNQRHIDRLNAK